MALPRPFPGRALGLIRVRNFTAESASVNALADAAEAFCLQWMLWAQYVK